MQTMHLADVIFYGGMRVKILIVLSFEILLKRQLSLNARIYVSHN